jgi:DNA-binding response OmpR family regulator
VSAKILVVEDDPALREGLRDALSAEGYRVEAVDDGERALDRLFGAHLDLVLLDVSLPKRNGFDICREVRARGLQVPIVFLTVRGEEVDRVLGLELGADDYVSKPFSLRELLARVGAILRRARRRPGEAIPKSFPIGDRVVDFEAFVVRRGKEEFPLAPKEAAMLRLLVSNEGRVVTRERFLDEVWGRTLFVGPRTVDTHVGRLRAKVEDDPASPKHILTVHGVGYRFVS